LVIAALAIAAVLLLAVLAGGAWLLRPSDASPTAVAAKPTSAAAVAPTSTVAAAATSVAAAASPTRPAAPTTVAAAATPATAASPAPTGAPAGATAPAVAGSGPLVILYSSHSPEEHDSQIWTMDLDGSNKRPLTSTRGHSWAPRLAPDGRRFLFSSVAPGAHTSHDPTGGGTSTSPGNHDIYIANADGSEIVNVTSSFNSWDNGWSWSPDGKWIAFSSDRDGNWELYKMTATGDSITRLTNDAKSDGWPTWTPDGKSIVFSSDRTGNWELYSMNDTGAGVKQLTERTTTYDTFPAVSPDGKKILFSSQVPGRNEGELYAINIDGSGLTRLTSTVAMNNLPAWCPDGRIVFVSDRNGNDDVWIMNGDGSGPTRLTANRGEDTTPSCGVLRRP
jgi:TolB protein